jgi:hypothetical protein
MKVFVGDMNMSNTMEKNIWRQLGEAILILLLKSSNLFLCKWKYDP